MSENYRHYYTNICVKHIIFVPLSPYVPEI